MKTYYLYYLIDPNNNTVRYVGITYQPKRRYREHINSAKKLKNHKANWINSLLIKNQKPIFKIVLETENKDEILEYEIKHIANIQNLTNSTSGGEYCTFTPDVIKKLIEKRKYQAKHIWTEEEKHNLSLAHSGVLKDDNWKRNIGLGAKYRKVVTVNGISYSSIKEVMRELKVGFKKAQSFVTN